MLYEMMAQDVITKKYKVPDEEVNKEVEKVKTIWRSIQKVLENNRLKDEEDFKNQIKFKLAMNEAIKKCYRKRRERPLQTRN